MLHLPDFTVQSKLVLQTRHFTGSLSYPRFSHKFVLGQPTQLALKQKYVKLAFRDMLAFSDSSKGVSYSSSAKNTVGSVYSWESWGKYNEKTN